MNSSYFSQLFFLLLLSSFSSFSFSPFSPLAFSLSLPLVHLLNSFLRFHPFFFPLFQVDPKSSLIASLSPSLSTPSSPSTSAPTFFFHSTSWTTFFSPFVPLLFSTSSFLPPLFQQCLSRELRLFFHLYAPANALPSSPEPS